MKQKHSIVKELHASSCVSVEEKKQAFDKLKSIDISDLATRTEKYCEAAIPDLESKSKVYTLLLEGKQEIPLMQMEELCFGCN